MNLSITRLKELITSQLLMLIVVLVSLGVIGCNNTNVMPREGSLQGKVLTISGIPLEGATVRWSADSSIFAYTDENGEYFINNISFGTQSFVVEREGYKNRSFSVSIYSGMTSSSDDVFIESKSFDYSDIVVDSVSSSHAVISWKTTDYTYGMIEYGETQSFGSAVKESDQLYSTTHSVKLPNLSPEKLYYFRIVSSRQNQPAETSVTKTFSTISVLEDNSPPTTPNGVDTALNGEPGKAVVFWSPIFDSDLKGYKIYRSEYKNGSYQSLENRIIPKGQERYTDSTVIPGKKYYYRVTSIDQAGNESGFNSNSEGIVIPGRVISEIRWTVANSPYILKGDITVTEFGILRIDDGVKVLIDTTDAVNTGINPDKIEITVSGSIITSSGPAKVIFASNTPNPNKSSWQGIIIDNSRTKENILENITISDATEGLKIKNSDSGVYSGIEIQNCNKAFVCQSSTNISVNNLRTKRCSIGAELLNNTDISISESTFMHPEIALNSEANNGINISGCNFLEYTQHGISSNESGGIISFNNNLFVSPTATAMLIKSGNAVIENNTYDSPYAIQIVKDLPLIRKNLIMAKRSVFGSGKIGIEYQYSYTTPEFGPNNIQDFSSENAYVGCTPSIDSTQAAVLLMKDYNGEPYDYRLRQDFPTSDDVWGIQRDQIISID